MSDKTLVKRLIEAKSNSCADFARMFGVECKEQKDCMTCKHIVCCSIANAIEGEYIPRPRFEDGEPVQFGDAYTDKYGREWPNGIKSIHIDCNGNFSLHSYARGGSGQFEEFKTNERVKKPEPNVFDADGVPIRKGDTIWAISQYVVKGPMTVTAVEPGVVSYKTEDGGKAYTTQLTKLHTKNQTALSE